MIFSLMTAGFLNRNASAQKTFKVKNSVVPFKIGEKITYNISFEKFGNAGYAEFYVVSRGKLSNREAVELHSKIKTNELVSAAFYLFDESRQTFASAENGHPLYVRNTVNSGVMPEDSITNFLRAPTEGYDFLSLIYSLRYFGAEGLFSLIENEKEYTIGFQNTSTENVRTASGSYETTVSSATSDFFTEKGISNFRINFSNDDQKIPVMIRFRTSKGEFKATLASMQTMEGGFSNQTLDEPLPTPLPTPEPAKTPKPVPTPTPYVDNQPLSADFPFKLGENLNYQILSNSQIVGTVSLKAASRQLFSGRDSLLLSADFLKNDLSSNLFNSGDTIRTYVNPDLLTPFQNELRFNGALGFLNQTNLFDQKNGAVTVNAGAKIAIPVGTHSLLSLIYAIRAFNLKPSKDPTNPVNDTRVAVFYENQPYVFTLRPSEAQIITSQGEKISAQLITISTGNPQLDMLNPRLWLSNDDQRQPLRLTLGTYQVDLISDYMRKPQ